MTSKKITGKTKIIPAVRISVKETLEEEFSLVHDCWEKSFINIVFDGCW